MKNWRMPLLGLVVFVNTTFAAPQTVDQIAAIVNNGVVLESEVQALLASVKLNARRENQQLPADAQLRHQILERLIVDNIQIQLAQKQGVTISDDALDKAIAGIAAQNRMTPNQLRSRLASEGTSYKSYRAEVRKDMLTSEARNSEVRRRISILPQEVEALAKQLSLQSGAETELNLSHLLIPLPENPSPQQVEEAQTQAQRVVDELKSGANFSKMAITYSADAQALKGGLIGWTKIQEMPVLFAEKLVNVRKGEIIGPLRSGVGFHILKVNDTRGGIPSISVTEMHARHILLKPSIIMTDEQAQAKLEEVAAAINGGQAKFEDKAKQLSQDPGSALQGGDLGWTSPDMYDPAFRDALLKLNKGQVSEPVLTSFGWHLIQLIDTRQVDKTDAAQKERAYRMLFNRKFNEEAQTWIQEQRAAAYVKIPDESYTQP